MSSSDKSSVIFGNAMDSRTVQKAEKSKQKYIRKFGDDSEKVPEESAQDPDGKQSEAVRE